MYSHARLIIPATANRALPYFPNTFLQSYYILCHGFRDDWANPWPATILSSLAKRRPQQRTAKASPRINHKII